MNFQFSNFKLRVFKIFLLVFSFSFLVFSFASPVRANVCGDSLSPGGVCCELSNCRGRRFGSLNCIDPEVCCLDCVVSEPEKQLDTSGTVSTSGITNPVIGIFGKQPGQTTIGYLLATFIKLAYLVGALLLLIYFIWGAIEWLTAGGTPESVKNAKNRITNAFVGLALLAGTYLLAVLIKEILNIDILKITLPSP